MVTIRNPASVTGAAIGVSYDVFVGDGEVCLGLTPAGLSCSCFPIG